MAAGEPPTPTPAGHVRLPVAVALASSMASNSKPLTEWTVDDVCSWATSKFAASEVVSIFRAEAISGVVLLTLSDAELASMGISKFGWRRELVIAIQGLTKSQTDPSKSWPEALSSRVSASIPGSLADDFSRDSAQQHGPSTLSPSANSYVEQQIYGGTLLQPDTEDVSTDDGGTRQGATSETMSLRAVPLSASASTFPASSAEGVSETGIMAQNAPSQYSRQLAAHLPDRQTGSPRAVPASLSRSPRPAVPLSSGDNRLSQPSQDTGAPVHLSARASTVESRWRQSPAVMSQAPAVAAQLRVFPEEHSVPGHAATGLGNQRPAAVWASPSVIRKFSPPPPSSAASAQSVTSAQHSSRVASTKSLGSANSATALLSSESTGNLPPVRRP